MSSKRAILSVTNDLSTDNRVDRTARLLVEMGYEVLMVGRRLPGSLPLERAYSTERMKLMFRSGPLFYAEYNLRLFFFLLLRKADVLVANDLDTLLPNFLISKLKNKALVYDSHEYFTEVPELAGRGFARNAWLRIEQWILPKLKHTITVNRSIAAEYQRRYGSNMVVVRNTPDAQPIEKPVLRSELGLPEEKRILIMQGSGINVDRGAEEAVLAMKELPDCLLLFVGGGDALHVLHDMVKSNSLGDRVLFKPRMPYADMMRFTACADLGLTLDRDSSLNYRFSLPNKLFDYIHAGIPVLATELPEVAKVVNEHEVGWLIPAPDPSAIVNVVNTIFADPNGYRQKQQNTKFAAASLNWQQEKKALEALFRSL